MILAMISLIVFSPEIGDTMMSNPPGITVGMSRHEIERRFDLHLMGAYTAGNFAAGTTYMYIEGSIVCDGHGGVLRFQPNQRLVRR